MTPGNGFDMAGWRQLIAAKLSAVSGHECLVCMTPHGPIDLVSRDLLHWYIEATAPAELIALNYLLSNARAVR